MSARRVRSGNSTERYAVERVIGRGGMATVYLARDRTLRRSVALKVLAPHLAADEAFRARFLREARLAARLTHPNVVQVYDVGEDERGPFIVMEYVEGETLADDLRRRGPLPPAEVAAVGIQLCAALEAAHAERLVHRDIKPQNILRRPDGQVKLADFGIARSLAGTSHTEIGTVLGTAAYLAPEQGRGESVTAAADIYSLGVVLYELVTGRVPFSAGSLAELLLERVQGAVTPPGELVPGVPAVLDALLMSCLAQSAHGRPASATELARELASSLDAASTDPHLAAERLPAPEVLAATEVLHEPAAPATLHYDPSLPVGKARWTRRRGLLAALLGASVLVLALLLAFVLADSGPGHQATTAALGSAHSTSSTATTAAASSTKAATTTTATTPARTANDSAPPSAAQVIGQAEALMQANDYEHALPLL
ncbi:MAG: protein kinase, partial [Actinomycetota bacterium]|nr:protein kinase [Actinomycetota bacterium]